MRIVVGVSGSTGVVYGVRVLEMLKKLGVESHLVITPHALLTLRLETDYTPAEVEALATEVHPIQDIGATIASGSFKTAGMIVAPCSVKTLSGIVTGYSDNLLLRAADVTLKEGRKLVLMFRETPLHLGHLRLLVQAAEMGATVFPPVPAFYALPKTIDDLVNQTAGRVLDQFGLDAPIHRWEGTRQRSRPAGRG